MWRETQSAPSLSRPSPPRAPGQAEGLRRTDSTPDSLCVPRAAMGAWFGPGLRGGDPKRKKVQEDTLSLQQHHPWAHPSVASPEPRPRHPGAPLLSELLSPHPRDTAETGTQPWGIRALVIPARW